MMLTVTLERDGAWVKGRGQDRSFWDPGNVLSLDLSAGNMGKFI